MVGGGLNILSLINVRKKHVGEAVWRSGPQTPLSTNQPTNQVNH